jgi:hypothetical protein
MNTGKIIFSQVTDHLPLHEFRRCVARYRGHDKVKSFSCLDQLRENDLAPVHKPSPRLKPREHDGHGGPEFFANGLKKPETRRRSCVMIFGHGRPRGEERASRL